MRLGRLRRNVCGTNGSELRDAPTQSAASRIRPRPKRFKKLATENPAEAFKLVAEGFSEMIEEHDRVRSAPRWRCKSPPGEIARRKIGGVGVQSAPKQKRELEILPPHFFMDAKINWNETRSQISARPTARASSPTPIYDLPVTTERRRTLTADTSSSTLAKPADQGTGEVNARADSQAVRLHGSRNTRAAKGHVKSQVLYQERRR